MVVGWVPIIIPLLAGKKRFDSLLDFHEPLRLERSYKPAEEEEVPAFSGPSDIAEAEAPAGVAACVDLIRGAVGKGACTEVEAQQLFESLSEPGPFVLAAKARRELEKKAKGACFVEVCCASDSQLRRVAKSFDIEYLGLSLDFVDLSDPDAFAQVEAWAVEKAEAGVVIHLLGSLPCTPWVTWQYLNLAKQGEEFTACLESARKESLLLVGHFTRLAEVAVCSGGSASKHCLGWSQQPVRNMISQFNMK